MQRLRFAGHTGTYEKLGQAEEPSVYLTKGKTAANWNGTEEQPEVAPDDNRPMTMRIVVRDDWATRIPRVGGRYHRPPERVNQKPALGQAPGPSLPRRFPPGGYAVP